MDSETEGRQKKVQQLRRAGTQEVSQHRFAKGQTKRQVKNTIQDNSGKKQLKKTKSPRSLKYAPK